MSVLFIYLSFFRLRGQPQRRRGSYRQLCATTTVHDAGDAAWERPTDARASRSRLTWHERTTRRASEDLRSSSVETSLTSVVKRILSSARARVTRYIYGGRRPDTVYSVAAVPPENSSQNCRGASRLAPTSAHTTPPSAGVEVERSPKQRDSPTQRRRRP